MSDPDDWNYIEEYGGAKALVYGILLAWTVLIIGGCAFVIYKWWP